MATKSIGSAGGRDYSTLASWEAALAATLTEAEVGECYNDSEFTSAGNQLTVAGITTSATNTITLKCAAGQSFRDNANVQTKELRYNASNGVGIRTTNTFTDVITNSAVQYFFMEGLQIKAATSTSGSMLITASNCKMTFCIFEGFLTDNVNGICFKVGTNFQLLNSLAIDFGTGAGRFILNDSSNGLIFVNSTIVRVSGTPSTSIATRSAYGTNGIIKNCAVFGFDSFTSRDAAWATGLNNASDKAIGFGSSNQASVTYSSQFENITSGTHDYRAKSGGALINNGVTDATYGPIDIAKTSRPSGASYDIGCWELVSAAAALVAKLFGTKQAVNRASTY
jgi:hypothetical protein